MANPLPKLGGTLILHPFLFALFPLLSFYAHNQQELRPRVLTIPLAATISLTALLWLCLSLIYRNKKRAAPIASIFLLLFFSYGHLQAQIETLNLSLLNHPIAASDRSLLIFSLFFLLLISRLVRWGSDSQTMTLNLIALSLVLFNLARIIPYEAARTSMEAPPETVSSAQSSPTSADIYYIILDRYAASRSLRDFYGFDNSRFINFLTTQGFYVAPDSFANYPKTYLSLASSLNMKHLKSLSQLDPDSDDLTPAFALMRDSEVRRILKQRGYRFIYFGNWWDATRANPLADVNVTYQFGRIYPSEFSTKFLQTTMLKLLLKKFWLSPLANPLNINYVQAKTTLYTFEKLKEVAAAPGPKFVYAHILVPHPPYVFGRHGEISLDKKPPFAPDDYVNQLIFTNQKVQETIETILAASSPKPVIILQGDEGPFNHAYGNQGEGIDWTRLSDKDLRLHLGILNAYYLPNEEAEKTLYPSITPVNSFRLILNALFKTNYELLDDTVYIIPDTRHPYQFIDVTKRLRH
jgi:hypothetical protein